MFFLKLSTHFTSLYSHLRHREAKELVKVTRLRRKPSLLGTAPAHSPYQTILISFAWSGKAVCQATNLQPTHSCNLSALAMFPLYLGLPETRGGLPSLGRAAQRCRPTLKNPLLEYRFAKALFLCFETAEKVIFRPFLCLSSAQSPASVHSLGQMFCRYQQCNSANLGMMR